MFNLLQNEESIKTLFINIFCAFHIDTIFQVLCLKSRIVKIQSFIRQRPLKIILPCAYWLTVIYLRISYFFNAFCSFSPCLLLKIIRRHRLRYKSLVYCMCSQKVYPVHQNLKLCPLENLHLAQHCYSKFMVPASTWLPCS